MDIEKIISMERWSEGHEPNIDEQSQETMNALHNESLDRIAAAFTNELLCAGVNIRDERLEALSDMVRNGQPIGFGEALEVIQYQDALKQSRKRLTLWARFLAWLGV